MSTKPPTANAKLVIKALEKKGFMFRRQSAIHAIYAKDEGKRVTVPVHGKKELGKGLLR